MDTKKKILKICFFPLTLLNKFIPKNPNKIFFYSNLGFRDNVKALFDYIIENGYNERYKIVVSTDETGFEKIKNVAFVSLKKGIPSFLTSKYCFYSFGKYPIKPGKSQKVVNLWHGMPLKSIGNLEKGSEKEDQNFFTHIIATSQFFKGVMCKAFKASEDQVIITNQPRCDIFFKESEMPQLLKGYEKVVVLLPTFLSSKKLCRNDGKYNDLNPFKSEFLSSVSKKLVENNVLLVIKPHPMDDTQVMQKEIPNIVFLTEEKLKREKINLYNLLKFSSALVTDFSSVYFDYLMLDKPIAFMGNYEEYEKNRGFAFERAKDYMPGKFLNNEDEFLNFVISDNDEFKEERQRVNEIVNEVKNSSGCENILQKIKLL